MKNKIDGRREIGSKQTFVIGQESAVLNGDLD